MSDAYEVLGVSRNSSQAEIKDAYRALAKALHPDVQSSGPSQAERFKEVSAAYGILSDRKLRAGHDRGEIDATGAKRRRGAAAARPCRRRVGGGQESFPRARGQRRGRDLAPFRHPLAGRANERGRCCAIAEG